MTDLDQREYYEYLEARHKRLRIMGLISLIIIILIGFSNQFYDSKLLYQTINDTYLVRVISVICAVHVIRTWNGSDELKFLREIFR